MPSTVSNAENAASEATIGISPGAPSDGISPGAVDVACDDPPGAGEGVPPDGISPAITDDERMQTRDRDIRGLFMSVLLRVGMQEFLHRTRIEQLPKILASKRGQH
jgi:hypothetical protein